MAEWERQLEEFNSLLGEIAQKGRNRKGENRFGRPFIIASDVAAQYFCEKKVEMEYLLGEVETDSKMLGDEAHEKLLEGSVRIRRKDLWKRIFGEKPVLSQESLLLARYKDVVLAGVPDSVLFLRGHPLFLFEYKFTRSQRPFRDHHVQARIYGVLLRNMGFDTSHLYYAIVLARPEARYEKELKRSVTNAVIENGPKENTLIVENARIFVTKFDETGAEEELDWAIGFWKDEREAIPTRNPNKCRSCEYNASCDQQPSAQ